MKQLITTLAVALGSFVSVISAQEPNSDSLPESGEGELPTENGLPSGDGPSEVDEMPSVLPDLSNLPEKEAFEELGSDPSAIILPTVEDESDKDFEMEDESFEEEQDSEAEFSEEDSEPLTIKEKLAKVEISGSVSTESRTFFEKPQFAGQLDTWQTSVVVEPELFFETEDEKYQLRLQPFYRYDFEDDDRSHFDLREANLRRISDQWDFQLGIGKVFWGVTESQHLIDVINQDDFVEDIDREDKLGQQMVNLKIYKDWGTLSFFVLPGFRERTFPGERGRLRAPLTVANEAVYESSAEEWHTDFALRYSHYLGNFDFGIYYFWGTGREPRFQINDRADQLVAHYDIIHQGGLDVQYTKGALLLKAEALVREGKGDTFAAVAAGAEYTLFQIKETAADLGLLAEYHWDGRDSTAPLTLLENDLFVGTRLSLNDAQDATIVGGAIFDMDTAGATAFVEFERRFYDDWKLGVEGRFILNGNDDPALAAFQNDSFLTVRVSRYF